MCYAALAAVFPDMPRWGARAANVSSTTGAGGHMLLRLREVETVEDVEVLFLGSSQTYRGFDPRIFATAGLDTFNLGSSAQSPLNTYYLLEEHIERLRPRLVLMETYWPMLSSDGVESAIDIVTNTDFSPEMLRMALMTASPRAVNSAVVHYLKQRDAPIAEAEQRERKNDMYVSGGYVQFVADERPTPADLDFGPRSASVEDRRQVRYVRKIVELSQEHGASVVLVRAPVTRELLESITDYRASIAPIEEVARETGVEFIDFNDPALRARMDLDSHTDFADKNHLAPSGVAKFNGLVIDVLGEGGYLDGLRDPR